MNSIISRLCVVLGKFLAASNDLTLEDRLKIKEMLEPYILLTTPLKESKIYSKKAVQECYEFPRYIILQPEKWMADQGELLINLPSEYSISENPMHTSLTKILENNLDTDMGLQYGFRSIMTMNGYTAKVPLHDYDTYEPLIKLTTRIGESRIFSADPVIYYTMSRGLYGGEKLFPHTQSHLSTFGSAFKKMVKGKNNLLLAESLPGTVKFNDQAVMNSVWGMALSSYESMNSLKSKTSGTRFTSPKEILFPTKPLNTIFVRLLFALADREVEQIVAVSTWSILSSIRHLQIHWESICDDIENGTLGIDSDFDSNLIEIVNSNFKKSKERADELRSIFKAGFDKDILKKIWPKLKRIIAENDGIYSLYTSQLKLYSGDIEIEGGYLLRDCNVIGEPSSNSKFYKLMTDDTFYEFIPISDSTFDGKLLQAKELKVGEEYEVVITNNSGLYRFKTREIICVEEMNDDMPLFSISHTKFDGIMLKSGTNENILHPGIIGKAIAKVSSEVGIPVSDFTYADSSYYDNTEGISLLVIIEASGLPDELNALLEFGKDKLCDMLDYELKKSFISYKELRENGELSLKVEIGEPETNLFYYDMKRFADELVQDQITPVKHLSTPEKYKFFVNRIM